MKRFVIFLMFLMLLFPTMLFGGGKEKAPTPAEAPKTVKVTGSTLKNPMGVPPGKYPGQYELEEFERLANVKLTFKENPEIAKYNDMIPNNPPLPPIEERLPEEPLVIQPYYEIGHYGGRLHVCSLATEAGTSDVLSLRHVNLVRISEDYSSFKPDIAKGWKWNDDYTEILQTNEFGNTFTTVRQDETDEDIIKTIELVERLRNYRSLIVPLIFIPMEVCALRKEKIFTRENLKDYHYELMAVCMDHDVYWVDRLFSEYFKGYKNIPIKLGYWIFSRWVKKSWEKRRKEIKYLTKSLVGR